MSAEGTDKSAPSRIKDIVEAIGKIFLGIVAILYVTGFTVVNLYLNKFGVSSVEFFKTSYIAAGFWTFVPLIVPSLLLVTLGCSLVLTSSTVRNGFVRIIGSAVPEERSSRKGNTIFVIFVLAGGASFLFIALAGIGVSWHREWFWDFMMGVLATASLLVALSMLALSRTKGLLLYARVTLAGLLACVIAFLEVFSFAYDTFGTIPAYLGGGAPARVELCLEVDKETRLFLQTEGLVFSESTGCTGSGRVPSIHLRKRVCDIDRGPERLQIQSDWHSARSGQDDDLS